MIPGAPPTDCSIQVIVEIEARAVTVFGKAGVDVRPNAQYALDALELTMAKTG
jgi:hypothetical protein